MPAPTSAPRSIDTPLPASEGTLRRTAEELSEYVAQLGGMLIRYGCPAYRVENLVRVVAELEGHEAEAFALPTGLFVTVWPRGKQVAPVHRMIRVRAWGVDLDKLLHVDAVFNDVALDKRSIEAARADLDSIDKRPLAYPRWAAILAAAVTSGAAAVLFRGSGIDVALAAVVGLLVFALGQILGTHAQARYLLDFVGALVAGLASAFLTTVWPTASREVVLLAGMLAIFPGMTFTTGLAELAQKNLVAGSARLMEAAVTFVALVFGIAVAIAITTWLAVATTPAPPRVALAIPIQAVAAIAISLGLGVAFNIPRRLMWAAMISGITGYATTAIAGPTLPSYVAAFLAATTVCSVANVLARHTDRPAQLYHLPGMMLLVPGSLGFLSLDDLLRGTYQTGVEKGLLTLLVGGGLVMGVLCANVVIPPKKIL